MTTVTTVRLAGALVGRGSPCGLGRLGRRTRFRGQLVKPPRRIRRRSGLRTSSSARSRAARKPASGRGRRPRARRHPTGSSGRRCARHVASALPARVPVGSLRFRSRPEPCPTSSSSQPPTASSPEPTGCCGVGPVEAASATARVLALRRFGAVLHVGLAGARGLDIGTLAIGTESVYCDLSAGWPVVDRVAADATLVDAVHAALPDAPALPDPHVRGRRRSS